MNAVHEEPMNVVHSVVAGAGTGTAVIPEPHAVASDGRVLATRVFCVDDTDGTLLSPIQRTRWEGTRMKAREWSDKALVSGEAGLHAICYRPDARPENIAHAIGHVLCSGRIAFSSRGLRAEEMEIASLVVYRVKGWQLVKKYGVPVRVVGEPAKWRNGRFVTVSPYGEVKVERRRNYVLHGRMEEYSPNGETIIKRYRNGELHSMQYKSQYESNSKTRSETIVCRYCDGELHGLQHRYILKEEKDVLVGQHIREWYKHGWLMKKLTVFSYYDISTGSDQRVVG